MEAQIKNTTRGNWVTLRKERSIERDGLKIDLYNGLYSEY